MPNGSVHTTSTGGRTHGRGGREGERKVGMDGRTATLDGLYIKINHVIYTVVASWTGHDRIGYGARISFDGRTTSPPP